MLTETLKQSGLSTKVGHNILRAPTMSLLTHSPDNKRILFTPPLCLISPVSEGLVRIAQVGLGGQARCYTSEFYKCICVQIQNF
ncbi:MAG: hypothetical protein RL368_836 [Pseudomonadota bacterium]|jgi:hypothetical protein